MPQLEHGLSAERSIILAIDTSSKAEANSLLQLAAESGAWVVKMGLEVQSAPGVGGWEGCANMVADYGLDWVADAKLKDIGNTGKGLLTNISGYAFPPVGITVHTDTGVEALKIGQKVVEPKGITLLGVTFLTSIDPVEAYNYEGHRDPKEIVWDETRRAVAGGIGGLVCAGQEVEMVRKSELGGDLFMMIPGTRSAGANVNDQKRPTTPGEAILAGADLLVIGRQVTESPDPAQAYASVVNEIRLAQQGQTQII